MKLPLDLVWDEDGHADEVALAAIADGELDLLPDNAIAHVGACDVCTSRLGEQAWLSVETGALLGEAGRVRQSEPALRKLPTLPLAAALLVALLGAVPSLLELVRGLAAAPELVVRGPLLLARGLGALVRALAAVDAGIWAIVWTLASLVLLAIGLLVARRASSALKEGA
jgi:hypothetical protein